MCWLLKKPCNAVSSVQRELVRKQGKQRQSAKIRHRNIWMKCFQQKPHLENTIDKPIIPCHKSLTYKRGIAIADFVGTDECTHTHTWWGLDICLKQVNYRINLSSHRRMRSTMWADGRCVLCILSVVLNGCSPCSTQAHKHRGGSRIYRMVGL